MGRPIAEASRELILDTAERLFAERGFYGVTVRAIAVAAGVDPALPNHHFGPKKNLFDAVLTRRASILMADRELTLRACLQRAGDRVTLTELIDAYTGPYLDRSISADTGWKHYFKLLAKVNTSPEWAPTVFQDHFDPFVLRFIDALRIAAPGAPEERYYWCYQFFSGALVLTFAETGRIDRLSGGRCASSDLASGRSLLVDFITAGCERLLRGERPTQPQAG